MTAASSGLRVDGPAKATYPSAHTFGCTVRLYTSGATGSQTPGQAAERLLHAGNPMLESPHMQMQTLDCWVYWCTKDRYLLCTITGIGARRINKHFGFSWATERACERCHAWMPIWASSDEVARIAKADHHSALAILYPYPTACVFA